MSCAICSDPLTLSLAPDSSSESSTPAAGPSTSSDPTSVPDDLHLPCACHFHWQCLLDTSPTLAISLRCPSCNTHLPAPTNPPTIPATYTSEGGPSSLDLLPLITEEAFLASNPAARPARALHTMAAEGDVQGMVDLLGDVEESGDDDVMDGEDLVRWRDPLNGSKTALHVAVEAGREEVVWFLLWVGSGVGEERFPGEVVRLAQEMGVPRGNPAAEDVRGMWDGAGRWPVEVAEGMGSAWGEGLLEVLRDIKLS